VPSLNLPGSHQAVPSPAHVGLRANLSQFSLLVLVSAFVGGMVGLERTVVPIIAQSSYGIASYAAATAFIATFGLSKAVINLFAGALSDRLGRRLCLLVGWLIGIPVPLILMFAPDWSWVLFANVLLGVNQALTWSMTVNMKIDLAGPRERGLAIGLNEFAGYSGLALVALVTGFLAGQYGPRSVPFYLGAALAVIGTILSTLIRDTRPVRDSQAHESSPPDNNVQGEGFIEVLRMGTWKSTELSAASLAGLVTNLKDGMLWGLLPVLLVGRGLGIAEIGLVVALYPAVWGVAQLVAGPLSDRVSRKALIPPGLIAQGLGVWIFAWVDGYGGYLFAAMLVGLGTALVYPTLQAYVSDVAAPSWRAAALGVYRFWRDMGYVVGALGAGAVADVLGIESAFTVVATLTVLAGITFALRVRHGTSSNSGAEQPGVSPQPRIAGVALAGSKDGHSQE
jgi:MFS family permease